MQKYDYFMSPDNLNPDSETVIHNVGFSACPPNYTYSWDTRDYYLLHYIISGKGIYTAGNKNYELGKNNGFLITPNSTIMHLSDIKDPWTLYWVGFNGKFIEKYLKEAGLDEDHLIFRYEKDDFIQICIENIYNNIRKANLSNVTLAGHLYLLLGNLIEQTKATNEDIISLNHFEKAARYIKINIRNKISIEKLAEEHNVDPSQMYRSFKRHCGLSPKQYLEKQKIDKACDLIKKTDLSFSEISEFLGYEYDTHFYKIFKKHMEMRPSEYKRQVTQD